LNDVLREITPKMASARPAMSKGEITVSNDVGLKRPRIRTCQAENVAVAAPRASFFPLLRLALSAFPSTIPMNEKFAVLFM
jgi:hypothetical protein